jgi:hypothetical protein
VLLVVLQGLTETIQTLLVMPVLPLVVLVQHQETLLVAVVQRDTSFMEQTLVEPVPVTNSLTHQRPALSAMVTVLVVQVHLQTV